MGHPPRRWMGLILCSWALALCACGDEPRDVVDPSGCAAYAEADGHYIAFWFAEGSTLLMEAEVIDDLLGLEFMDVGHHGEPVDDPRIPTGEIIEYPLNDGQCVRVDPLRLTLCGYGADGRDSQFDSLPAFFYGYADGDPVSPASAERFVALLRYTDRSCSAGGLYDLEATTEVASGEIAPRLVAELTAQYLTQLVIADLGFDGAGHRTASAHLSFSDIHVASLGKEIDGGAFTWRFEFVANRRQADNLHVALDISGDLSVTGALTADFTMELAEEGLDEEIGEVFAVLTGSLTGTEVSGVPR